jgi:hypothetical protein
MTTLQLRRLVRATFPDAYCARWRLLDHSGDMQYRISNPYRNHTRIIGDVCHTVHDAWASVAATLPNSPICATQEQKQDGENTTAESPCPIPQP